MGIIALEGMYFHGYHGYYKHEREHGNRFRVDAYLKTNVSGAAIADELEGTVDYEAVYKEISRVMDGKSKLLEYLAQQMITTCLEGFPQISWIKVRVAKLTPPIKGDIEQVYVELEQSRN